MHTDTALARRLFRKPVLAALAAVFAVMLAILASAAISPSRAFADSYDCPEVNISAQAQTDGSLRVVEQRTFDFDGAFSAVWWNVTGLPWNAEMHVNGVRVAAVDDAGNVQGDWTALPEVGFQISWRDSGGPSAPAWSFDETRDTLYAFSDYTDARVVVEVDYTVENAVQAYDDIAEVYWKYVPEGWGADSHDVSMTIALPVPSGVTVTPGDNVRAWGHGPLDGTVSVNEDGTVTYEVPLVRSGQYAEARVVFPVDWLTNLDEEAAQANQGVTRLDTVLAEEKDWADQANNQRVLALAVNVGIVVACVAAIAIAVLLFLRFGREHKPDFVGEYWRDVPDKSLHPAAVGRLWRWNHESCDDFTATVMSLAHRGAVRISKGSYADPEGKLVDDYYLTRVEPAASDLGNPVDRKTIELLFDRIAGGAPSLWLGTIREYGKHHSREYADLMASWQGVLSGEVNKHDFFETAGKRLQMIVGVFAVLFVIVGIIMGVSWGNFLPPLAMVPTGAVLLVIANYMPRRTEYGNNVTARAKALRNWLRDFSSLDERPPTDVKVWGEFMVYAYLFGVAEQAIKELRQAVPSLFEDADMAGCAPSFVPWYVWYMPAWSHAGSGSEMPSIADAFDVAVSNTLATAQAAVSAANASMSGADGFGGGFSVGGGGGFGGGGGAR